MAAARSNEESSQKVQTVEELKRALESQVQSLNEKIVELENDLEMKSSGAKASEMCLRDELNYFMKRVSDLESELDKKSVEFESQLVEAQNVGETQKEEIAKLEAQLKEKIDVMTQIEGTLGDKIANKDEEIDKLKKDAGKLASTEEVVKDKDDEIQRLMEQTALKDDRLHQIEAAMEKKSELLMIKETELKNLEKAFADYEADFEKLTANCSKQREDIQMKQQIIDQHEKKLNGVTEEVSVLRLEVDRFQSTVKDSDETMQKSREIETNLKQQIHELAESKVKLEADNNGKDAQLKSSNLRLEALEKEIEERDKCIAGLEAEVKSVNSLIAEKTSSIDQLKKDFADLKAQSQTTLQQLEASKQSLYDDMTKSKNALEESIEKIKADRASEKSDLCKQIDELKKLGKEKDSKLEVVEQNVSLLSELKASLEEKLTSNQSALNEVSLKLNKVEREDEEKVRLN